MAACRQLQQVVMKLVKESFGDTYYDKALDCLRSLREEGIKVSRGGGRGGEGRGGRRVALSSVRF